MAVIVELHAEQVFELADRRAERRLRNKTGVGRAAEMADVGQRREIPQLPQRRQVHISKKANITIKLNHFSKLFNKSSVLSRK